MCSFTTSSNFLNMRVTRLSPESVEPPASELEGLGGGTGRLAPRPAKARACGRTGLTPYLCRPRKSRQMPRSAPRCPKAGVTYEQAALTAQARATLHHIITEGRRISTSTSSAATATLSGLYVAFRSKVPGPQAPSMSGLGAALAPSPRVGATECPKAVNRSL